MSFTYFLQLSQSFHGFICAIYLIFMSRLDVQRHDIFWSRIIELYKQPTGSSGARREFENSAEKFSIATKSEQRQDEYNKICVLNWIFRFSLLASTFYSI